MCHAFYTQSANCLGSIQFNSGVLTLRKKINKIICRDIRQQSTAIDRNLIAMNRKSVGDFDSQKSRTVARDAQYFVEPLKLHQN